MIRSYLLFVLSLTVTPVFAGDTDADALLLADQATGKPSRASDWNAFAELAGGPVTLRDGTHASSKRLSIDVALDRRLSKTWRLVLADRLDVVWNDHPGERKDVNVLKDAYFGWQIQDDLLLDLGRVNLRNGVATGYNPTDYFRTGAVRLAVSADPASLKQNRQGSVMVRTQKLWDHGSISAVYSPKLASQPDGGAFNPNVRGTNNQNRGLVTFSQALSENVKPQWLLYKQENQPLQVGLNLAMLLTNATVGYVEWSGGRSRSLLARATNGSDDSAHRNQLSTGLTYTTSAKLTLTLEYEYNGAALPARQWNALPQTAPNNYVLYLRQVYNGQDIPARNATLFYGTWRDAFVNRFDLSAMVRYNNADHSRLSWLEARYRWDRVDTSLQWQHNSGNPFSEFGGTQARRIAQMQVRYYF
jgi:hypothetical protein